MFKRMLLLVALAGAVAGCKTQTGLTAGATGCGVTELDVIESRYSREGTTTAWCGPLRLMAPASAALARIPATRQP